ncbi:MAG: hypothetical protein FJY35_07610 [Betaproteobacteria bacterium]|nr:hypothetical protein [Betaproteobacteria bacterium]
MGSNPRHTPARLGLAFLAAACAAGLSGCDQVQQRLAGRAPPEATPPAMNSPSPASPNPASSNPAQIGSPQTPGTVTPPLTRDTAAPPQTQGTAPPSSTAPETPRSVERFSSHHGSTGAGPVERRSSSNARQ